MKRVIVGILLLILGGCTKEESVLPNVPESLPQEVATELYQLQIDSTALHFVVGWLSNEEILFVRQNTDDTYALQTFNLFTKELTTVYEDDTMITNVLVHPLKEYLLIHTSTDATAATVKIINVEGVVQNEMTIESTELEIAWHDLNPSYLLLTAFYEDWSFDAFFFDSANNYLQLLSIEDPFPKWFGHDQFITMDNQLGAEALYIHNVMTERVDLLDSNRPLFFDTYQDALFTIREAEDGQVLYEIVNGHKEVLGRAKLSSPFEDLSFLTFAVTWLTKDHLLFFHPNDARAELTEGHDLMAFNEEGIDALLADVKDTTIACSPDGEHCLVGTRLEELLNMKTFEKNTWLQVEDLDNKKRIPL